MRPHLKIVVPFAVATLLTLSCSEPTGPDRAATPPSLAACSPETCGGTTTDPNPAAPGYFGGTLYTPTACYSATGANINDADYDATSDFCEQRLAALFAPSFVTAPASYDCDPGMEPYWAAKYFPNQGVLRIAYLFSYYRDCGADGGIGGFLAQFFGKIFTFNGLLPSYSIGKIPISASDPGESHSGDSEFITVDLRWNPTTLHWYVDRAFLAAHFGTSADGSRTVSMTGLEYGDKQGGYPRLWIAANKHAAYPNRNACNAGRGPLGLVHDNCDSNAPVYGSRMFFSAYRNVGSAQGSLLGVGACVKSANRPTFNPGTECYLTPNRYFYGWLQYPYGPPPTPYYSILMAKFECYSYTTSGSYLSCTDWGKNIKP